MARHREQNKTYLTLTPLYGREEFAIAAPKTEIPNGPMAPDSAYQIVMDELLLDGRPRLNLATFVNTYEDEWGRRLAIENLGKNFIDHEEYPASNLAEKRCIWMLAKEYGTTFDEGDTDPDTARGLYGSATIGSSEAVMLGLIAHKYKWNQINRANLMQEKADPQDRPVVLMSAHAHSCWDKFCRYYGALALYVEMDCPPYTVSGNDIRQILETRIEDPASCYAKQVKQYMNYLNPQGDRTIGELIMAVGAVVGTTFTGNSDDVVGIDRAVEDYCKT